VNDQPKFENLQQLGLTHEQQSHLFGLIAAAFEIAIDARSPKNRPPGKAGLRAEKGYYRLLYLEDVLHERVITREDANPDVPAYHWDALIDLVRQLTDMPELRSEMVARIERALDEMVDPAQAVN
jgi:hypothetical protein